MFPHCQFWTKVILQTFKDVSKQQSMGGFLKGKFTTCLCGCSIRIEALHSSEAEDVAALRLEPCEQPRFSKLFM